MEQVLNEAAFLAIEVHALLGDLDPARWRAETAAAMRQRLHELEERIASLVSAMRGSVHAPRMPHAHWAAFLHALREAWPEESSTSAMRDRWMEFRARMEPAYQELAAQLRATRIHIPTLRPTNYVRNAFHVASALAALLAVELLPVMIAPIATALALWAWSMETMRRTRPRLNAALMRAFGPVAHPHETHRVNSATWYTTALVVLAWTQAIIPCALAVTVLGVGDPIAAIVGRRYGRTKLVHGRSLEGSLAFFITATLAAFAVLTLWHPTMSWPHALATALAAAGAGAAAELLSLRIDDNLSVPLAAAGAAWLVAYSR